MKRILIIGIIMLMLLTAYPVLSDDTKDVTVTLSPSATASIYVNQSVWNPGCGLGENETTATNWANLDNDGSVSVDVTINASDTNAWTLGTSYGHNQFQLQCYKPMIAGADWIQTTSNTGFPAGGSGRYIYGSIAYDNKMWVMGGTNDGTAVGDVWYSSDGISWVEATSGADWGPRDGHVGLVYDNKMWIMGGYNYPAGYTNDVWYSTDGANWTRAVQHANWDDRIRPTAMVYDNKMWIIGGDDGSTLNDVWYSTDGVNWTEATSNANWSDRSTSSSVVYDNKMWIIGGLDGSFNPFDDVWYSTDGVNWTEAPSPFGTSGRWGRESIVFDNKMWVMGGMNTSTYETYNDVWCYDGSTWTEITANADYSGRFNFGLVVLDGKMWVISGGNWIGKNDVWYSSIGTSLWINIDSSPKTFVNNLAYDESLDFGLQIFMPTSSSTNTIQELDITYVATPE